MNARVEWLNGSNEGGADGMVGLVEKYNVIFAAYKDAKLIEQWGITVSYTTGPLTAKHRWADVDPLLQKYWSKAKAMGATRLCAKNAHWPGAENWRCYNGYSFSEGLTQQTAPMGITCPTGQVWDNVQKKCVPALMFQPGMSFDTKLPVPSIPAGNVAPQWGAPTMAFNTSFLRPQLAGVGRVEWLDDGHVGFGYSEGTPVWQPGLSEEEKKTYFPWGEYSDATKNLQLAINAFLATKGCSGVNADGKLGPETCAAAKLAVSLGGPEGVVGPPPTCKQFGAAPPCGPPPSPVIEPECTPTKLCPPGQKCEGGKCVPATTPGGGGGGSGSGGGGGGVGIVGVLLLAGAALGAIYLAVSGTGAKQAA